MASWETNATYAKQINADSYVNKAQAARAGKYSGAKTSTPFWSGGSYDLRGINATKIPAMIDAIESYIKDISKAIDKMSANASNSGAFKGTELQTAVTKYIEKVEKYLKSYTTQLRAFEDKIIDVRNAWNNAQKAQATNINKTASSFADIKDYNRQLKI